MKEMMKSEKAKMVKKLMDQKGFRRKHNSVFVILRCEKIAR